MKIRHRNIVAILLAITVGLLSTGAAAQVNPNRFVAQRYLEHLGKPEFAVVGAAAEAPGHRLLRHEFENLKYNADDPVIAAAMQPAEEALSNRVNTVTRLMAEGDLVAATMRITGTHTGNLFGIPATGRDIDIESGVLLRIEEGKVTESWFLADEALLLLQLDEWLPARQDGQLNLPPSYDDSRSYDAALEELLANPMDTPEYRNKRLMLAYKATNKPAFYEFDGRPYQNLLRSGINTILNRAADLGIEGGFGGTMSERQDLVSWIVSEGSLGMMSFRLTATHGGELYGIPPSGSELDGWELGVAEFNGDTWENAWWMQDELGLLLAIGNEEALNFLVNQ